MPLSAFSSVAQNAPAQNLSDETQNTAGAKSRILKPWAENASLDQNALKAAAAAAALDFVPHGARLGVGTGSTVNFFIDALAAACRADAGRIQWAVSSSEASTARLRSAGIAVQDAAQVVEKLDVYVDGADEISPEGCMIKGGGAALTREKIVANMARRFVCIADASKQVAALGAFPLPVEVVPMAAAQIMSQFKALDATAALRLGADGAPLVTDNGQHIVDVRGLRIEGAARAAELEKIISAWPGVLTVGIFARNAAHIALFGTRHGVEMVEYPVRDIQWD